MNQTFGLSLADHVGDDVRAERFVSLLLSNAGDRVRPIRLSKPTPIPTAPSKTEIILRMGIGLAIDGLVMDARIVTVILVARSGFAALAGITDAIALEGDRKHHIQLLFGLQGDRQSFLRRAAAQHRDQVGANPSDSTRSVTRLVPKPAQLLITSLCGLRFWIWTVTYPPMLLLSLDR